MAETSHKRTHREYCGDWDKVESITDVFEDILSRLPVRTLLGCKFVSKHWYRVISGPQLAKLQLLHSTENPKYILFPQDCCRGIDMHLINGVGEINQVINLPCFEDICFPKMICSFNGLIYCLNVPSDLFDLEICVINPATRRVLLLPQASQSILHPQVGVFFGPGENEYKIFWFFCDASGPLDDTSLYYECDVYHSKTGSWRRMGRVPFCPMVNIYSPSSPDHIFVGGKLYWFLQAEEDTEVIPGSILSVDEDENFTIISIPFEVTAWSLMIDLKGSLGLITIDYNMMYIWVLTNHEKSSWFLRVCTKLSVGVIDSLESVVARENEIFFIVTDNSYDRYFHVYNLASETWRELRFGKTFEHVSPGVFAFTESLLSCS